MNALVASELTSLYESFLARVADEAFLSIVGPDVRLKKRGFGRPILAAFKRAFMHVTLMHPSVSREVGVVLCTERTQLAFVLLFLSVNGLKGRKYAFFS